MREKLRSASGRSNKEVSIIEVLDEAASRHRTKPLQIGEIMMRNRAVWFLVGAVLVCVLALVGTGLAMAAVNGAFGASGAAERPVSQETTAFGVTHVFIRHGAYSPSRIQVVLGTAVTWTNQDVVPHSVILSPVVISVNDTGKSELLYPGQSFSYTFTSRGTFTYSCSEHPEMVGTVIVT